MKPIVRAFAIALTLAQTPWAIAAPAESATAGAGEKVVIDVYKSPDCHCCKDWMKHLEKEGFATRPHHPADLDALKAKHGVPEKYESCHTGVTKEGYVFEGHVPAKFIRRFLAEPPAHARGLSVPGMPLGSPGMESDDFFMPYKIMLLKDDGSAEIYANVTKAAEQWDGPAP